MATREISIDFYELVLPKEAAPFGQMLASFVASTELAQRTKAFSGQFIRVNEAYISENTAEGDFTKLRMDNIPDKGSPTRPDQPLGLQEDEGLSAARAFFYYAPWKAFLIQRNRNGATIGEIEGYFKEVFGLEGFVELRPILQKDAYIRLQRMQEVKKFEVKFAGLHNATLLKGESHDTEKLIDLLEYFQAPQAAITVSVGRSKHSSLFVGLKEIASRLGMLAREHPKTIKKVELGGLDADGKRQIVDLLLDPMVDKVSVKTVERRLPYASRRAALAQSFSDHKDDLKRILAPTNTQ